MGLLPLASIIIEPAKVLFLNNAINHGVLSPLGIQQAQEFGKSMFFLLEANPGPGFGVLLAYWFFGKGMAKESTPGAMIIHVLGGIHEIYFPDILMKPVLLLAVIAGGMSSVFTLNLLGMALPPGFRFHYRSPRHDAERRIYRANIADFLVATAVSCAVASIFIKRSPGDDSEESLEEARESMMQMKNRGKDVLSGPKVWVQKPKTHRLCLRCRHGFLGLWRAAALAQEAQEDGFTEISVTNCAIGATSRKDVQPVVSHEKADCAPEDSPQR